MHASDLTASMTSLPAYAAIAFGCRCLRRVRLLCKGHHKQHDLAPADRLLDSCSAIVFGGDPGCTGDVNRRLESLEHLARDIGRHGRTYLDMMLREYVEGVSALVRALATRDAVFGFLTESTECAQKAVECAVSCVTEYSSHSDYYLTYESDKFDVNRVPSSLRDRPAEVLFQQFQNDLDAIVSLCERHGHKSESLLYEDELPECLL